MDPGGSRFERERSPEVRRAEGEVSRPGYIRFRLRALGNTPQEEIVWGPIFSKEEAEELLAAENMKQWLCCVFVCSDPRDNIIESVQPVSDIIAELDDVNRWVLVGERNASGIFHVHALLCTNRRSDSIRRSINKRVSMQPDCRWSTIKLATTHSFKAMFSYMLKDPLEIEASELMLLQLGCDIICYGYTQKYLLPKHERKRSVREQQIKAIVHDVSEIIRENNSKTVDDVFRAGSDILVQYLHISQLRNIVQNCLDWANTSGGGWSVDMVRQYAKTPKAIHATLQYQGVSVPDFDKAFYKWLFKKSTKINTICFYGPSNTGKSAFIQGLKQLLPYGEIQNTNSGFAFEGLADAFIGVWEEPLISPELAEKCKLIFEGMPTSIPIKYRKPKQIPRIPIVITTNHWPWRYCSSEEAAFRNRMHIVNFMNQAPAQCTCSLEGSDRQSNPKKRCISETLVDEQSSEQPNKQPRRERSPPICSASSSSWSSISATTIGGDTGTFWCNDGRRVSSESSSSIERSNSSRPDICTSTSIVNDGRSSGNNRPGYTSVRIFDNRIQSSKFVYRLCRTEHGIAGCPGRSGEPWITFVRRGESTGSILSTDGPSILTLEGNIGDITSAKSKATEAVDRELCACVKVPTKTDWACYINWLSTNHDRIYAQHT